MSVKGEEAMAGAKMQVTPDERVRLGLPIKATLSPVSGGRVSEARQRRYGLRGGEGARFEGVLLLSERVLRSAVAGQTGTIAMGSPFRVALTRWDEGGAEGQVELGVEVRQGEQVVEFCAALPREAVSEAVPRQERASLCLDGGVFAALWPALEHLGSFHGAEATMRGVTVPEGLKGRSREAQARPGRVVRQAEPGALRFVWGEPQGRRWLKRVLTVSAAAVVVCVVGLVLGFPLAIGAGEDVFALLVRLRVGSVLLGLGAGGALASLVVYGLLRRDEEPFVGDVSATRTQLNVVTEKTSWMVAPPGMRELDRRLGGEGAATTLTPRGALYALDPMTVAVGEVEQLYVAPFRRVTPGRRHYAVFAAMRDGTERALVRRLRWSEAAYLEVELERFWSIADAPVRGEHAEEPPVFRV